MGKVDFRSHLVELPVQAEKAYAFLVDLNHFKEMMPEQVINWQSTEDDCSFDIKGMAHITLSKSDCIPGRVVRLVSGPETPVELEITANLEEQGDRQTGAWIGLSAELSPMLQLLASQPLQNLVNIMAEKLKGSNF